MRGMGCVLLCWRLPIVPGRFQPSGRTPKLYWSQSLPCAPENGARRHFPSFLLWKRSEHMKKQTQRNAPHFQCEAFPCVGVFLSSRAASSQVLSAPVSLTAVFGMGTGVPSPSSTPTSSFIRPSRSPSKPDKAFESLLEPHVFSCRTSGHHSFGAPKLYPRISLTA